MNTNNQYRLFNKAITVGAVIAAMTGVAQTRILCVGDSITEGTEAGTFYVYRPTLNSALSNAGYEYTFVGSKINTLEGATLKHEGYGGKNAAQVASYLQSTFPNHIADIVLIHAGHNYDATVQAESVIIDAVDAATRSMIATARTHNPNVAILLAQVVTSSKLPKYSYIPNLNIRIAALAAELHTSGQPVILVNQADGWDPVADTVSDLVHPTQQGAIKMANKWFVALQTILPTPSPMPPAVVSMSPTNNAINVPVLQSLVLTFDKNITTNSVGFITLTNTVGAGSVRIPVGDSQLTLSGMQLTINPSSLLSTSTTYSVLIDTNAIKGAYSGLLFEGITNTGTWRFTTAAENLIGIVENFETSSAGSGTPPAGWSLIKTAGTYSTSAAGAGSNGAGGSAGLAGQVSSTANPAPGNNGLPGAYLVNSAAVALDAPVEGSFDFRLVHESTFDDVGFIIGDVANGITGTSDGELLYVRITEGEPNTTAVILQDGTADGTSSIVASAGGTILDDTWYRATVTWTPTNGTIGTFTFAISNFSSNVVTMTTSGFAFDSVNGYIGFGSINDTIRFDHVSFMGSAPLIVIPPPSPIVITNKPAFDSQGRSTTVGNMNKTDTANLAVGPVGSGDYFRTYLTFDLTSASNAVNVTLKLDGSAIASEGNTSSRSHVFTLFKLDTDWHGAAHPGPTGTALATTNITVAGSSGGVDDKQNISFSSTALAEAFNAAVGGTLYLGVKTDQEGQAIRSFKWFGSREDSGQEPRLIYQVAPKTATGTVILFEMM
jgi:lysophospholipase L1-like esterase